MLYIRQYPTLHPIDVVVALSVSHDWVLTSFLKRESMSLRAKAQHIESLGTYVYSYKF